MGQCYKPKNPVIAFKNYFEIIDSARDISFPEVKVKQKPSHFKHNPWISNGLKISQKRKEKWFAKKLKSPTEINLEAFKIYNKIYNKLRRAAKKLYYKNQFDKFTKKTVSKPGQ